MARYILDDPTPLFFSIFKRGFEKRWESDTSRKRTRTKPSIIHDVKPKKKEQQTGAIPM
ncbi:Uncharacterized protein APZ42_028514 [Daphnia magna]|uniref:Uncharacterized protein n=1 Tax=Daphnia magna TaxID=35525 RepID=A0A162D6U0_9CRUS|nr:Uncharacterized protein APZ42_028514 [Daphnia magna]